MNEKYIPLYRKYRPQIIEEIVGQEHVKKALTNAIELNKIAHAYLFTGPRGTGKTSTARILAKSLNCENGPTTKPCGKCPSCLNIINSVPIDVIEIDAASNRKVEDTQSILERIQYTPVNGKYKIYIIDEVHMLTNHAFNALLKTLEEPPENVIFILATTEVHKVLDTIKSRCQRYDFKRITTRDIVTHLKKIAELESININDDAIATIAKNSAGGMRDSLSLLDQLGTLGSTSTITVDDINVLLGRLSFEVLNNLSNCIIDSNPQNAIEILEEIYHSGNEPSQILSNLLNYFKNLLITKTCKKDTAIELTQLTDEQINILSKQAENLDTHQIVFLIEKISYYIKEVKFSTNQHLWLEVSMIDLANLAENTSLLSLQERLTKLEGGHSTFNNLTSATMAYKTPPSPVSKPSMKPATGIQKQEKSILPEKIKPPVEIEKPEIAKEVEDFAPMPKAQAKPVSSNNASQYWHDLLVNITSPMTQALLNQHAIPVEISAEKIVITFKQELFVNKMNDKKQEIINAANTLFNQTNSNVIIRLPMSSDTAVDVSNNVSEEQPKVKQEVKAPQEKVAIKTEEKEVSKDDSEDASAEDVSELNLQEINKKEEDMPVSDQTKMVMQLFDGKYID